MTLPSTRVCRRPPSARWRAPSLPACGRRRRNGSVRWPAHSSASGPLGIGVDYDEALSWLSGHINLESDTSARSAGRRLEETAHLVALLGDPQQSYPAIHITGTNGKGSVARMITRLLMAKGLSVGTY